jgi:amidase
MADKGGMMMLRSALASSFLLAIAPAGAHAAHPAEGTWILHLIQFGEEFKPARAQIDVDGTALTGTLNELKLQGQVGPDMIQFSADRLDGPKLGLFNGRLVGSEWRGTITRGSSSIEWVMRRVPERAAPRTYITVPKSYSRTFSGLVPPLLRISPGDTVKTVTVDSSGQDRSGSRVALGGNPQTGPFFVEGAVPGDTLVVKLNRIRPNRERAQSGTQLLSTTVSGDYHKSAQYSDTVSGEWVLNLQEMTARLAKPTERLRNYKIPVRPFLGGIGVAPPDKQAIEARSLGSWGGNLDYSGLQEGTTIYLPVYNAGALLFLGDGHAAQGDGELTGDALETSMDVEFTVDLLRGKHVAGPRAESKDYLMVMGIAGSQQEATRLATAQLADWLITDLGLSSNEVAVLLGTAIEYDIAELVDPQINVVAKIKKSTLEMLRPAPGM